MFAYNSSGTNIFHVLLRNGDCCLANMNLSTKYITAMGLMCPQIHRLKSYPLYLKMWLWI